MLVSGFIDHDGMVAGTRPDPNMEFPPVIRQAYAEVSPDGPEHFDVVAAKTLALMGQPTGIAMADLAGIASRTLVMAGDDDIVTAEHSLALSRTIPNAELAVIPGATHMLLMEKPALCNAMMLDFLTKPPAPTFMPIRRAS